MNVVEDIARRGTVAGDVARQVAALKYEDLPKEVLHQTKRLLLDTLACSLAGIGSESGQIIESVVRESGGTPESTVIGSGLRTNCIGASWVNGVLARYADFMDNVLVFYEPKRYLNAGHASMFIPGVLAVGERQRSSGKDAIVAINLAYQLAGSFQLGDLFYAEGFTYTLKKRGFDPRGTSARLIMPYVAGKLLGLSVEQMENALGVSLSYGLQLGITDAPHKGVLLTMAKNLRYPDAIAGAIMAALLAEKGFTGPTTVVEGGNGFIEVALGGRYDVERFTAPWQTWYITSTYLKFFWAEGAIQGTARATLSLVEEKDIRPEDVVAVRVKQFTKIIDEQGNPVMRRPPNKESADHSIYYVCARMILDRALRAEQYTVEKITDPKVHELIDKITVEADPSFDRYEADVEIETRQGQKHHSHVLYPKGHPLNPLTDEEIEQKFRDAASKLMSERRIKEVIAATYSLDDIDDIGKLMKLLVV